MTPSLFPSLKEDRPEGKTCRTCRFRLRQTRYGQLVQYCRLYYRTTKRHALRQIKASDPACSQYQPQL